MFGEKKHDTNWMKRVIEEYVLEMVLWTNFLQEAADYLVLPNQ